jgi:hypothetical protein
VIDCRPGFGLMNASRHSNFFNQRALLSVQELCAWQHTSDHTTLLKDKFSNQKYEPLQGYLADTKGLAPFWC